MTVLRYLKLAGKACRTHHDKAVRGVKAESRAAKSGQSTTASAPTWPRPRPPPEGARTWTAIDADSKLIVSCLIGEVMLMPLSTSHVEKQNQTIRRHIKRFARLTAGHSKKINNHVHMVALDTCWYNFARIDSALRMPTLRQQDLKPGHGTLVISRV
jgi:hypothetical protein